MWKRSADVQIDYIDKVKVSNILFISMAVMRNGKTFIVKKIIFLFLMAWF